MKSGKTVFLAFSVLLLVQCQNEKALEPGGGVPAAGPGDTAYFNSLEKSTWREINRYRKSIQLPALKASAVITDQCREHSGELATGKVKPHDGFQSRVKKINTTMHVMAAGEVIYQCTGIEENEMPERALKGWLESKDHKSQVEGTFTHAGVGMQKSADGEYFVTVIFVDHFAVY